MRVLVYRLGSLGDTIVALPCFHLIREKFPKAEIVVLTNAPISGKAAALETVLAGSGLIDRVLHYPLGLRNFGALAALRQRLAAERFDLLIDLAAARGLGASLRDALFFRACGIRQLLGIPLARRDLVCRPKAGTTPLTYEAEAERLLRRIRSLGDVDLSAPRWWDLRLTPGEHAEARAILVGCGVAGDFIAVSLGTKSPLNDWGEVRWRELLDRLAESYGHLGLVLLGSEDEAMRSEQLAAPWPGAHANLCGRTSPRISAAVLAAAHLFIGHDSGPMHLAAAAGTPCVAIFSAKGVPGQWFPFGPNHAIQYPYAFHDPSRALDAAHQRRALDSITAGQVTDAALVILGASR